MVLMNSMWDTAKYLCQNIQGCKLAYTQSDEITLLLTDYDDLETSAWFDKNIQKMVSISASIATLAFNKSFKLNTEEWHQDVYNDCEYQLSNSLESKNKFACHIEDLYSNYSKKFDNAMFDSRVFNLPKEEVCNCFIFRQIDCTRNAIQMVGQANFSHKQLQNKSCNQIQEMLWSEKDINFNDFPTYQKRGACIAREIYDKDGTPRSRWTIDENIPIFTQDRDYINKYI